MLFGFFLKYASSRSNLIGGIVFGNDERISEESCRLPSMDTPTVNLEAISKQLFSILPEKERRLFAAYQALERGYGGISSVHRQYGISINAIIRGQAELKANTMVASGHQRRQGGGRKGTLKKHPELSAMFARLLEAHIAGDPQNGVLWTDKTDKELQAMLSEEAGFPVGISIVKQLLAENGLGKRKHRKTKTMGEHTERNAQFERIAELREDYHERGQVVLSMDTKKRVGW